MIRPWQLFLVLWVAFLFGPLRTSPHGEVPAEMLCESLLSGHGIDLSPYYAPRLPPEYVEVRREGGRVIANVAVAHGLASLPFAAGLRLFYPDADPAVRARMTGRVAGAFFTAAAVAVTFASLLRFTEPRLALVLALGAAFASPLYSTASRSATPHGPAALAMAAMLWLAVGDSAGRRVARGAVGASLYFLRPPSLLAPAVLLATLGRGLRPPATDGVRSLILGGVLAGVPLAFLTDAITGRRRWGAPDPEALLAYAVSPGRSLFLFAPIALVALAGALRTRPGDDRERLARACGLTVVTALVEIACRRHWWGGFGFGPHWFTDYVPLLAAMAAAAPPRLIALGPALFVPVALLHGQFVFRGGHLWDERRDLDRHPEAVWDLRDSPLTDLFRDPPTPDPATLLPAPLAMTVGEHGATSASPAGLPWLVHGWEPPEENGTWAVGSESWLALSLPGPGDYELVLDAAAPMRRGRPQRLEVEAPGSAPQSHEFARGLWDYETVRVRVPYRPGTIVVRFRPRHVWLPGKGDVRRCTFFVRSLRLDRGAPPAAAGP